MDNATARKHKIGNIWAVMAVLACIFIVIALLYGMTVLLWFTCIINFIAGPACLLGYLNEVRKGIFANDEEFEDDVMLEAE